VLALVLVACSGAVQGAGATTPRIVTLVATNFGYQPDPIEVHRGETIRFVVENPTDLPHEIFIGTAEEQAAYAALRRAAGDGAEVDDGLANATYVPPHGVAQLEFRFEDPDQDVIGCHLVGHWESGMHAAVLFVP